MHKQYENLLAKVVDEGVPKPDRTGIGTLSCFGEKMTFRLNLFPIVTTKPTSFHNVVTELLWFLRGDDNIKFMVDHGCNIWNRDAYSFFLRKIKDTPIEHHWTNTEKDYNQWIKQYFTNYFVGGEIETVTGYKIGDTGKQYPRLWRNWESDCRGIDQIANLINGIKNNPFSRRHIITAWNPATLDNMALPSCHSFVQFNVRLQDSTTQYYVLDCQLYQRSADAILGVPYNISSYSLLTYIIAEVCNMVPGEFHHVIGDLHLYNNHIDAAKEQIKREPYLFPTLVLNEEFIDSLKQDINNVVNFEPSEVGTLVGYKHYPKLSYSTPLNI